MSDELDDEGGDSFLDHFFNALGHASRAVKQSAARAQESRDAKRAARGPRKVKMPAGEPARAFDAAPAPAQDPSCCTTKR